MAQPYEVEALLRPAVEYFSALNYLLVAVIAAIAPEAFLLLPQIAYVVAIAFVAMAIRRFSQGHKVRSYHKSLWRQEPYLMSSRDIPVSSKRMFIGEGFRWEPKHTQRLTDLSRNTTYADPSRCFELARHFETRYENTAVLTYLSAFLGSQSRLNPWRPLPELGGIPALHSVGSPEGFQNIYSNLSERVGHTLVTGTTRVGKSRFAELIISQDIRRGDTVIVFDPKGDANLFKRCYVEARNSDRLDNFYAFHLGAPSVSARYSPVGNFSRVTEIASRISGQLPGSGQSAAFKEFVWRYVNTIAKALTAIGVKPTYENIKHHGENIESLYISYMKWYFDEIGAKGGHWRAEVQLRATVASKTKNKPRFMIDRSDLSIALYEFYTQNIRPAGDSESEEISRNDIAQSLTKTFEYEKNYLDKLVVSLLPLMEKLCSGSVGELLSPEYLSDDDRPIFSWPQVVSTGSIVYVGLSALIDSEVASAVGNSMLADLASYSGRIYESGVDQGLPNPKARHPYVCIHADEFNEIIGEEFIPLLNKSGGANYQVTAYTQTTSDIKVAFEDNGKLGQVLGNFNTVVMLRARDLETAELITNNLKDVEVTQLTTISGSRDSSEESDDTHFTSGVEQRKTSQLVPVIHPADITQLAKGQAFALLEGSIPYKIKIPLADERDFAGVPDSIEEIAAGLQKTYRSQRDWQTRDEPAFLDLADGPQRSSAAFDGQTALSLTPDQ